MGCWVLSKRMLLSLLSVLWLLALLCEGSNAVSDEREQILAAIKRDTETIRIHGEKTAELEALDRILQEELAKFARLEEEMNRKQDKEVRVAALLHQIQNNTSKQPPPDQQEQKHREHAQQNHHNIHSHIAADAEKARPHTAQSASSSDDATAEIPENQQEMVSSKNQSTTVNETATDEADQLDDPVRVLVIVTVYQRTLARCGDRTVKDLLGVIANTTYPKEHMRVWILAGDEYSYREAKALTHRSLAPWKDLKVFCAQDFALMKIGSTSYHIPTHSLPRYRNILVSTASSMADEVLHVDADLKHWPTTLLSEWVNANENAIFPMTESLKYQPSFLASFLRPTMCPVLKASEKTEKRYLRERFLSVQVGRGPVKIISMDMYYEGIFEPLLDFVGSTWKKLGHTGTSWSGFCYAASASGRFCKGDVVDVQRCSGSVK